MNEQLFLLIIFLIGLIGVFVSCSVACEYGNYGGGHRFIKAFQAKGSYQRLFTLLEKDVNEWDRGKITYIGYWVSLFCTFTGLFAIPFTVLSFFFGNEDIAFKVYSYWFCICFGLGVLAAIIQILDSLLNYVLELLGK